MNQRIIKLYQTKILQIQRLHSEHQRLANRVYRDYGVVIPESPYPTTIESMSQRLAVLKSTNSELTT